MIYEYWPSTTKPGKWQWFWHLKADNGEVIAQGEGYQSKTDVLRVIDLVRMSGFAKIGLRVLPRVKLKK